MVSVLALGSTAARAQDDELLGLWASETAFAPALQGELTLQRTGQTWRARIGEATAPCTLDAASLRCEFSQHRGTFRGMLAGGEPTSGWWLQPSSEPGAAPEPAFAGRIELHKSRTGEWRGAVQPLANTFNLYLRISRNDAGELVGAFRNPERNSIGGAWGFVVSREGDALHFMRRAPDGSEIRQEGTLLRSPDRLKIRWEDLGAVLELRRSQPAQTAHALPQRPGASKYAYRKPPQLDDGWTTASAQDVGLDAAALVRLVQRLDQSDPFMRGAPLIHSLLVARRGKLVLEEYFFGYSRDMPHDTRSAGKTYSSVMLGAAMLQGVKISQDTPIYELLAARGPFANPDPRKARITLAHLMTHTSGLDCDDNNPDSAGNEGTMTMQRAQPDYWKYTLDLRQVYDPGTHYAYCSANTNLVGGALTTATHTWLPELFDRSVARPLQFGRYYWNLSPNGEGYQGGGARVRPRDLLKIGQLYLDSGIWHGKRVVSPELVSLSTAQHIEITPATTGLSAEEFPNYYGLGADGFTWHLGKLQVADRVYQDYLASGNGGQLVIVVPEAQLVVGFTAGNYGQGGIWTRWPQEIAGQEIIGGAAR
jgi:CubicO group peptidase (beta-lactamase class C family)